MQGIILKLEGELFAVDASNVSGIAHGSRAAKEGRRVDLRELFFGRAGKKEQLYAVTAERKDGESLVLLVGEVGDVVEIRGEEIVPIPKFVFSKHASFFQGVILHKGELVPVIDLEELVGNV